MASPEQCITQIDDIFDAAGDPSAAYLIRSRLRRAVLSCARLVAASSGATKPDLPGVFSAAPHSTADQVEILRVCERIYTIAKELCQPSESFDVRWERGWSELRVELDALRHSICAMGAAGQPSPAQPGQVSGDGIAIR